jgi:hypothetical protein
MPGAHDAATRRLALACILAATAAAACGAPEAETPAVAEAGAPHAAAPDEAASVPTSHPGAAHAAAPPTTDTATPRAGVFADGGGFTIRTTPYVEPARDYGVAPAGELARVCDRVERFARERLRMSADRSDGEFTGIFDRARLDGCEIAGEGRYSRIGPGASPEGTTIAMFAEHGWMSDDEYSADGPFGTSFGMRLGELLCVTQVEWFGEHDDDPADPLPEPSPHADDDADRFAVRWQCAQVPGGRVFGGR